MLTCLTSFILLNNFPFQSNANPCSSSRRSHSSSFRRQRSHQQILLNHHQNSLLEQKRHTYYPCDHDCLTPCYAVACECHPNLCTQCALDDCRNLTDELITKFLCSCHKLAESDVVGCGIFTQDNIQHNKFILLMTDKTSYSQMTFYS